MDITSPDSVYQPHGKASCSLGLGLVGLVGLVLVHLVAGSVAIFQCALPDLRTCVHLSACRAASFW